MALHSGVSAALLTLVLASLPLAAADTEIARCRAVADPMARLSCYDKLVDAAPGAATPVAVPIAAPASSTSVNTAVSEGAVPAIPSDIRADQPLPIVSREALAVRTQTEAEFGLENTARPQEIDVIVSRIVGEFRGWQPKARITLENGQIWQISDGSQGVVRLQDPVVRIERGALGSFFLRIDGINKAPRVKRIK